MKGGGRLVPISWARGTFLCLSDIQSCTRRDDYAVPVLLLFLLRGFYHHHTTNLCAVVEDRRLTSTTTPINAREMKLYNTSYVIVNVKRPKWSYFNLSPGKARDFKPRKDAARSLNYPRALRIHAPLNRRNYFGFLHPMRRPSRGRWKKKGKEKRKRHVLCSIVRSSKAEESESERTSGRKRGHTQKEEAGSVLRPTPGGANIELTTACMPSPVGVHSRVLSSGLHAMKLCGLLSLPS